MEDSEASELNERLKKVSVRGSRVVRGCRLTTTSKRIRRIRRYSHLGVQLYPTTTATAAAVAFQHSPTPLCIYPPVVSRAVKGSSSLV
ncbi:unnamed protein product [Strongylus vulgaris]|uniref:Uncharacterized protein n=1 Tax=Strongylus vulgaris TaxID=40348 RepID=A0A3P7IMF2_STRVU|nr:unnamed protein product [Strongylus vulgaris]